MRQSMRCFHDRVGTLPACEAELPLGGSTANQCLPRRHESSEGPQFALLVVCRQPPLPRWMGYAGQGRQGRPAPYSTRSHRQVRQMQWRGGAPRLPLRTAAATTAAFPGRVWSRRRSSGRLVPRSPHRGAGGRGAQALVDATAGQVQEVVATNMLGTLLATRAAILAMEAQAGGGHIFNVDGAGADGSATPNYAAYGATKSGALPRLLPV